MKTLPHCPYTKTICALLTATDVTQQGVDGLQGALPTPSGYAVYLLAKYFWNTGQLLGSRMCCVMESPRNTRSKPCAAARARRLG